MSNITCVQKSDDQVECNGILYAVESKLNPSDHEFWIYLAIYVGLVLAAGMQTIRPFPFRSQTNVLQILCRKDYNKSFHPLAYSHRFEQPWVKEKITDYFRGECSVWLRDR